MAEIGTDVNKAVKILKEGNLIGLPTETVYGLAGNALNAEAVASIFSTKNRPSFDPLILHTHSINELGKYVSKVPEAAQILAQRLWPGPLTLLLKKKDIIPDLVTSGMDTVAVRIPNKALTLKLLEQLDFPLVAPSANPFGYVSPTRAQHVEDQLGDKIDYILDGGDCEVGIESTIVGFDEDRPVIHRLGGISKEKIESLIGKVDLKPHSTSNPKAPGMLASHYSPGKPVVIGNIPALQKELGESTHVGAISFKDKISNISDEKQVVLSMEGNLSEAAKNLFAALRHLDKQEIDLILAELVPDHGLGRAINDRLKRASAKK